MTTTKTKVRTSPRFRNLLSVEDVAKVSSTAEPQRNLHKLSLKMLRGKRTKAQC